MVNDLATAVHVPNPQRVVAVNDVCTATSFRRYGRNPVSDVLATRPTHREPSFSAESIVLQLQVRGVTVIVVLRRHHARPHAIDNKNVTHDTRGQQILVVLLMLLLWRACLRRAGPFGTLFVNRSVTLVCPFGRGGNDWLGSLCRSYQGLRIILLLDHIFCGALLGDLVMMRMYLLLRGDDRVMLA